MCLRTTLVRPTDRWNWEGDEIVRDARIFARRRSAATGGRYTVDIREFLATQSNAVVADVIDEIAEGLDPARGALFRSHHAGAFDLRVREICRWLSVNVRYSRRGRAAKAWLYPSETLAARKGDCEDLAFVLASLVLASGVSGYVVRVALGTVRAEGEPRDHGHAWVVYKDERGRWLLLDPLLYTSGAQGTAKARRARVAKLPASRVEYTPRFVFNDAHLWAVEPSRGGPRLADWEKSREYWTHFDPTFAATVHNRIFDVALAEMDWSDRAYVKAVSLALDADITTYHPYDHFDDGYVEEAWGLVDERLRSGDLTDFAQAAHAIGDFYAHSTYGYFATDAAGRLRAVRPEDRTGPAAGTIPVAYDAAPVDVVHRFSANTNLCGPNGKAHAAAAFAGKWLSGRYAQPDDPSAGLFENLTRFPDDLEDAAGFRRRGGLPHHDEIAVDKDLGDASPPDDHALAGMPDAWKRQYKARFDAAARHIRQAYRAWRS